MDITEVNKIKEMMEEVHNTSFVQLLEFKQQNNFPFDLMEDDLIVRLAQNNKNNIK
jgi:hypothetical protein